MTRRLLNSQQCGNCCHWRESERPRINGATDLSAPRMGRCCEGPPILQPLPQGGIAVDYLQLPANYMACDRFQAATVKHESSS